MFVLVLKNYLVHYLLSTKLLSPFLPLCIHPPFLSDVVFVHGNYQQQVNEYISRQACTIYIQADNKLTNLLQKLPSLLKIAIAVLCVGLHSYLLEYFQSLNYKFQIQT